MKQEFSIQGMTCMNCVKHVKDQLASNPSLKNIDVSLDSNSIHFESEIKYSPSQVNELLSAKYNVSQKKDLIRTQKSFWQTYRPILLIFLYLFVICTSIEWSAKYVDIMRWMRHFMAGFFLIFSFFKLLDPVGFKNSYQQYDVIAKRLPIWSYFYIGFEVTMGVLYLIHFNPVITNLITFTIMSISLVGVIQAVNKQQRIACACLGNVFDLPMSTITIVEDGLMILMAAFMMMMYI